MKKIKKILVTGSTGQLGQSLKSLRKNFHDYKFVWANSQKLNFEDKKAIENFFEHETFDIIINCAAYTAVDKAESEPKLANQVNHLAVKQLAEIAKLQNAKLIHISTDYVFNGKQNRPYQETDEVGPVSVYGKTKLKGDQSIKKILKTNAIIIRTSWVYSEFGNNFVKTMLKLSKEHSSLNIISDQVGTPTYAKDLAETIMCIIQSNIFTRNNFKTSIFHFSNEGVCSWYDFAKTIFEITNTKCKVSPIRTLDYPTPATRPYYSVLNKSKIKETFNLNIPYWKESTKHCLIALKEGAL